MQRPNSLEKLYLDFDSFFASAEQLFNPALRGRPVGVVPLDSPYTSLIAASREAKKFGFKVGTSVREARAICPDIHLIEARPDLYVKLHKRIIEVIERCVPIAAVRSIDEVVCTLLPSEAERPDELCHNIKTALAREIGPTLTCSIGISSSELLAKIAAEMNKPDGFVVLHPDTLPGRLLELKLRDLPGISRGMENRLSQAGITSVEQLWAIEPKHARAIWNSVEGERFAYALHGFAVEKPDTVRRMFGHGRNLPPSWRTGGKILQCARLLCMSAARRLRRAHMRATAVSYSVSKDRRDRISLGANFPAARDDHTFLSSLTSLHRQMYDKGMLKDVRSITVVLHGLTAEECPIGDLFAVSHVEETRQRWEQVSDMLDSLRLRYGNKALNLGSTKSPGAYIGGKIAFGRIPDAEDF
jgi:DNA polymerase IV